MNRIAWKVLTASILACFALPAHAKPQGADFGAEAKLLYRVVACAGDEALPAHLDAKTVARHCKEIAPRMQRYSDRYAGTAKEFIARLRPDGLPTTVVYPFGGGDLISVLTAYPAAQDITTLSLEHAGDPRRIGSVDKKRLAQSLALVRKTIWGLLTADNSTTVNLQKGQRGEIPGQLAFFVVALAVHGFEPVSLRYFRFEPDGSLHYLTQAEITEQEQTLARTLRGKWAPPDSSVAFSNMELTFRPRGEPDAPLRVHRHVAANLADTGLEADAGLSNYLESKGRISAITKAASYLLWREEFSKIRSYLLDHMEFMISDSTGIPPRYATEAGFRLETYGNFSGSFLRAHPKHNRDFRTLWRSQPKRKLAFRFGYIDSAGRYHMLVARKAPQVQ